MKQFNKRAKGTEQFWTAAGVEPILCLRAAWGSQDDRVAAVLGGPTGLRQMTVA